jgi:hypothetical protein
MGIIGRRRRLSRTWLHARRAGDPRAIDSGFSASFLFKAERQDLLPGPQSGTSGPTNVFSINPNGTGELDLTSENGYSDERPSASADGHEPSGRKQRRRLSELGPAAASPIGSGSTPRP